jgi:hypothetical protein
MEDPAQRPGNPASRWDDALRAVLRWLYDRSSEGPVWVQTGEIVGTDYAVSQGEPLPEFLLYRAAEQLKNDELIEAGEDGGELGGPVIIRLTREGRNCVDDGANVTEYLRGSRNSPRTVWNINSISGNLAVDSTYVTQSATTAPALDAAQLKVLLQAMREALPVLDLPQDRTAAVRRSIEVVEGELDQAEPDEHVVKTMVQRAITGIGSASQSALSFCLTMLAKYEMSKMGIPIS